MDLFLNREAALCSPRAAASAIPPYICHFLCIDGNADSLCTVEYRPGWCQGWCQTQARPVLASGYARRDPYLNRDSVLGPQKNVAIAAAIAVIAPATAGFQWEP
jgi:hypothetical protein